jgi:hypothetical protein
MKLLTYYKVVVLIAFLLVSTVTQAKPRIKSVFGHNLDGFARVKVINESTADLACYVAINGFKKKFRLPPLKESKWYAATDKRFNYKHFSTWCDYIDLHPEYKKFEVI